MKVFFFPVFPTIPHLETEFELMIKHSLKKDQVFFLKCNSGIKRCLINPAHFKYVCKLCMNKINQGLKLINFPLENIIEFQPDDINFNFLPDHFNNLAELMNFKYDNYEFGRPVISSLINYSGGNYEMNTIENKEKINEQLKSALGIYLNLLKIFEKLNPDIVYVHNGRFSDSASIIFACKKLNIKFFTHDVGTLLNHYLLIENTIPHDINYATKEILKAWESGSEEKYQIGKKWYIEKRYTLDKGPLRFTKFQKKGLLPANFDKNKKKVVIFNRSLEENFTLEQYKNPIYENEIEGISKIAESLQSEQNLLLYLRIHPNLAQKNNLQMQELKRIEKTYKRLNVIPPESQINSYDLMIESDIIVTFGTTMGIEAVFWNKPSILIGRSRYENLGSLYKPKTHEELISMIKTNLAPQSRDAALKYGYWQKTRSIPFRFFNQSSIKSGLFLGVKIYPSLIVRIESLLIRLFETKNLSNIYQLIMKIAIYIIKTIFKTNFKNRELLYI